jgi:hypothetical protein
MFEDPTIPLQKVMPATTQTALLVAMTVVAAAFFAYAIFESRRRRDLVPVFIMVGASLAVFYEPVGDALVKVYYAERGQETWIHAFGRDIPAFIGILYFWYMSVGALWLLRASKSGVTAGQWWARWAGFVVFATVFELIVTKFAGAPWIYYGKQPLTILDVPVLTTGNYVSFVVTIAAGTVAMARFLPRSKHWLIVPGVVILMAAGHAGTSLPQAVALYGTNSQFLLDLSALASFAMALLVSYLCSLAFRQPWPERAAVADQVGIADRAAIEVPVREPVAV